MPMFRMIFVCAVAAAASACSGATPQIITRSAPHSGSVHVVNRTGETWDLSVGGVARGNIGPRADKTLGSIPEGKVALMATNHGLDLTQEATATASSEGYLWTLVPQVGQLVVTNPQPLAAKILIDGAELGVADAGGTTRFESVPAGKRTLVARSVAGPGAVQLKRFIAPGAALEWVLPTMAQGVGSSGLPRPPLGKSLIWIHHGGRRGIRVFIKDREVARMKPGEEASVIVEPGTYTLSVAVSGVGLRSEHRVTISADQVAKWSYAE